MTTASRVDTLGRVAARTAAYPYRGWGFGEAIAMRGLLAASRATGDPAPRRAVEDLFARWWADRRGRLMLADHVAPGAVLVLLARRDPRWQDAARALGALYRRFPQADGLPIHRPDLEAWATHVWVDCLYTDGGFLARLASLAGDVAWHDLAAAHTLAYVRALWDDAAGLFVHGYDAGARRRGTVHWGRGNGWALLGLLDLLRALPRAHRAWEPLAAIVRRQIAAIVGLQHPGGHWHTVLDRPETYLETSVAAMMAYGLRVAARMGLAPPEAEAAAERAMAAALAAVDTEGGLTGTSEATPAGDLAVYATRPTGVFPWGQGPLLLALADRILPDADVEDGHAEA